MLVLRASAPFSARCRAPRLCRRGLKGRLVANAQGEGNKGKKDKAGGPEQPLQDQSVEALAQELLAKDPETAAKLQRVGDAARRVAELQAESARLAQEMAEAAAESEAKLRAEERQQSSNIAAAEVVAAEKLLRAAELQAEAADAQRQLLEAELAQDADRVESGKVAAVAAVGGTLASLPFVLSESGAGMEGVLTVLGVALSCLLFGVTYRYAVRTDLANTQLKGGVVAAFGLVRGVAQGTDALLAPAPGEAAATLGSGLTALPHAALLAGESMLTFAFASVAVELAFRQGFVKPLARGGSGSSGGGGGASSSS